MSAITDVRCVLTQEALDAFCNTFHILEEVHPVFPNQDDKMHQRPAGKIGLYTRFFDFANFRLPFSTFHVDILRHFRINISQLSVIGVAKNNRFFWVDDFACLASFLWHTAKHVIRDPAPVVADFNAQDYATLVAHPSLFRKFPKAFLCLVGLSRHYTLDEETYPRFVHKNGEGGCLPLYLCYVFYDFVVLLLTIRLFCTDIYLFTFIHAQDPTKVRVVERKRDDDDPRLLETTVGRTVRLLLVASDRAESELEASVDRLFDEGGSGHQMEQGDSTRGQGKRKSVVMDAIWASRPPKKLREDHGTLSGAFVCGKSRSFLQRLLFEAVLNVEVGVAAIPTLPFVTASVSTTPEREDGDHTDFMAELNLCTIGAPRRFIISSDSFHHSGTNIEEAEVNSLIRSSAPIMTTATTVTPTVDFSLVAKEKLVKPTLFSADSSSTGGADPNTGVFLDLTGSDFLVGGICTVIDPDIDLQKVYVFASVRGMELDQLFTEFNVGVARQMSLSAAVRMPAEYNVKERRRLKSVDEANTLREHNVILEKERDALDVKVTELETSAMNDYEFVDADDQAVASEDAASFPNVDDAELHIP
nr:hypothetical protein [Tanacetum cinerariifolium]